MSSLIKSVNPLDNENNNGTWISHALNLMRVLPGFLGLSFNPKGLVKAVNYFHSIGYKKSLQALRDYCALAEQKAVENNPENVFLVARILFVPKDVREVMPRLLLGQPDLEEPKVPTVLPLFPLCLYRDIPFLLIGGYRIGGEGRPPSEYVEWCAHQSDIRSTPLFPNNDPLASVDEFLGSDIWTGLNPENWHYSMLRLQALHAVSNVYPISQKDERDILSSTDAERNWYEHRRKFELLNVSWDIRKDEYKIVSE